MHKITVQFLIVTFLILFASCNYSPEADMMSYKEMPDAEEAGASDQDFYDQVPLRTSEPPEPIKRKLIVEGNIAFETKSIDSTRASILSAAKKYNAYVVLDNQYNSPYRLTNSMQIRIPSDKLDAFIAEATVGVQKFDSKNINSRDVTEEFLDLTARIKTKKELEKRYLHILNKANTVKDILEIERQIGNLRSEIESQEGKLRYLNNKVSFSTLTLDFYTVIKQEKSKGYASKFGQGFKNGWENLLMFFVGIVNFWPFVILVVGAIFGFRFWRKKK